MSHFVKKATNNFENSSLGQPAINYQNNFSVLFSFPPSVSFFLLSLFIPFPFSKIIYVSIYSLQVLCTIRWILWVFFPPFFFLNHLSIPRKTLNKTQTHWECYFQVPHLLDLSGSPLPSVISQLCSGLSRPLSDSHAWYGVAGTSSRQAALLAPSASGVPCKVTQAENTLQPGHPEETPTKQRNNSFF